MDAARAQDRHVLPGDHLVVVTREEHGLGVLVQGPRQVTGQGQVVTDVDIRVNGQDHCERQIVTSELNH